MNQIPRNKAIQIIHTAKKYLDLDDDTYRIILVDITKKNSCKLMTDQELMAVIKRLKVLGFGLNNSNFGGQNKHDTTEHFKNSQYRLCYVIWIDIWNAGGINNKSADALNSYIERMIPTFKSSKSVDCIKPYEFSKIIESLKNWLARIELNEIMEKAIKSNEF